MNGNVLLDTNVVVALFERNRAIVRRRRRAEKVFVPSIALGELFYGAYHSAQVRKNVERLEAFAATSAVLLCDADTGRHYGQIKHALRRKGRPIPDNDVWIAALAHQHDLTLLTHDTHFEEVEDLKLEIW